MKKLMVYMNRKWHTAVLIILLLILQAGCELMLPKCTADIIDIGIGQSGIENVLADTVSREGMEHLLLLMTAGEKETVLSCYTLDKEVYIKKELSAGEEETLLSVMTAPMVAVYALSTDGADYGEVLGEDLYVPRGLDAFGILAMLPDDTRIELTEAAREQIRSVPQSLITQAAVNFVRNDMITQGIDVGALQNRYLAARGIFMLLAAAGAIVSSVLALFLASRLAAGYAGELRAGVFDHVLSLGGSEFLQFSVSSLIARTTDDVRQIQLFLITLFRMLLYAPILGIGAIVRTFGIDRGMGRILTAAVGLCVILILILVFFSLLSSSKVRLLSERLTRTARETVRGMMVIRAFGTEEREKERLQKKNESLMRVNLRMNRVLALMMPLMLLIMNGCILLIAWRSADGINNGVLGAGGLVACIQYTIMVINAFLTISMLAVVLPGGIVAAGRVAEVLSAAPNDTGGCRGGKMSGRRMEKPGGEVPALEFQNVSFSYPGASQPALCDISFTAEYGETTAIIGSTGAGKTTLLQMIPGIFYPAGGKILIDGKETEEYGTEELHKKIGYALQEAHLFTGTAASNLRFRKENASDEELWQAVRTAQAEGFLTKTGKGLETEIAQGGKNLSGGQKQRLTVARALVGHPQILLLDDCFSALDPETAARLRKALASETSAAAVIIVTQSIGIAADAEKIIVMDQGRIVGIGTHEELLTSCRVYRQIAYSQNTREAEDVRRKK